MTLNHKCKFCQCPVVLEMDDSAVDYFGLEFWKSLAACNRCADYREKKRRLQEQLVDHSVKWARHKMKQVPLNEADVARLMELVEKCTKKYADLVCRFNHVQSLWQQDFMQQILDMPGKTLRILHFYERDIAKHNPMEVP